MGRFPNKRVTITAVDQATDWINAGSRANAAGLLAFSLRDAGSWSGTITFQCIIDPLLAGTTTYIFSVLAIPVDSTTGATTATAANVYRVDAAGLWIRAKCTTFTAGSLTIDIAAADG